MGMGVFRQLCLILVMLAITKAQDTKRKPLLYILLDGFRYDYVDGQSSQQLPGFKSFLENGVRAEHMTAMFPSISYPDWTTLVTGLWGESHGIVGNYFYDAQAKDEFSLFDADLTGKQKWWTAEPIWTTATKAGLRVAVILWSRCDVPFDGVTLEYCEPFVSIRGPEIFRENMEKALKKLEEGFDFVLLYNEYADNVGHGSGPETEDMKKAVRELDSTIIFMQDRLAQLGLTDSVNIIMVSDHGMATTKPGDVQRVELDDYLLEEYVENIADAGASSNIKVLPGYVEQVYNKLKGMPGVEVYKHEDIPEELHYKNNKYIHDIVLKADINTWIMKSRSSKQLPPRDDSFVYFGAHGFDPKEEKMWAIFFAKGPDFQSNQMIPPIKNVDVYPLLANLLQIQPLPHNGTIEATQPALSMNERSNESAPDVREADVQSTAESTAPIAFITFICAIGQFMRI